MTGRPWYWDDNYNDHDACGLVLGVGRTGNIHYVKANTARAVTACHSGAANFIELVYHGQVVTCRNCCSVAKHNRHRIKMRENVRPVISGQSQYHYRIRENQRVKEGRARSGRHLVK